MGATPYVADRKGRVKMVKQYAVGIDVGGTKILAGVVEVNSGQVVSTARKRTYPERGADFFTERLLTVVQEAITAANLSAKTNLAGVGIVTVCEVGRDTGILLAAP